KLTFEDLTETFGNRIELVEEIEYEGEKYIVTLYDSGVYSSWNISDGSNNHEVSSKYNETREDLEKDHTSGDSEEENEVAENDPESSILDELTPEDYKAMEPWGGDWDRIDNHGDGQGLITSRPPAMDVAITDNKSIVSGFIQVTSGNGARFYDKESGCELDLILTDEETIEVKEVTECSALISSPAGVYEHVGRRRM